MQSVDGGCTVDVGRTVDGLHPVRLARDYQGGMSGQGGGGSGGGGGGGVSDTVKKGLDTVTKHSESHSKNIVGHSEEKSRHSGRFQT